MLVELDVVVRDRDGKPVKGLVAKDFRVLEKGHERPIGGFSERDQPTVFVKTPEEADGPAASDPPTGPVDDTEQHTILIFLDHVALSPERRARVVSRLARYFRTDGAPLLTSKARLALITNDVPLKIQIPPTRELPAFLLALDALPKPPTWSVRANLDRQRAAEDIGGNLAFVNGSSECSPRREIKIRGALTEYIASVARRNDRTVRGLEALVSILGGMEGRKVVLYVGEGIEIEPGLEMIQRAHNACANLRFSSYAGRMSAPDLMRIAGHANSHRVTFYAFDSEGSRAEDTSIGSSVPSSSLSPQLRQLRTSNVRQSLTLLSRETGGRAFFNTGDPVWGFKRVTEDLRHSYSLAYVPKDALTSDKQSTDPRKVKVELIGYPGSGYKLLYRRAVVSLTAEQRLVAKLLTALWLGEESNILGVSAKVETTDRDTSGFDVRIRIPTSNLLLEDAAIETGGTEIRLFLMARDPTSGVRTNPRHETRRLTQEELMVARTNGAMVFVVGMELPPSKYDVAVGVRDEHTSRTSVVLIRGVAARSVL